jgi:hypothetical protein
VVWVGDCLPESQTVRNDGVKKLAEVVSIFESNSTQIVETLRRNADAVERGDFGECDAAVTVLVHSNSEGIQTVSVFGLGHTDLWHSLGVLQGGMAKLTGMIPE